MICCDVLRAPLPFGQIVDFHVSCSCRGSSTLDWLLVRVPVTMYGCLGSLCVCFLLCLVSSSFLYPRATPSRHRNQQTRRVPVLRSILTCPDISLIANIIAPRTISCLSFLALPSSVVVAHRRARVFIRHLHLYVSALCFSSFLLIAFGEDPTPFDDSARLTTLTKYSVSESDERKRA